MISGIVTYPKIRFHRHKTKLSKVSQPNPLAALKLNDYESKRKKKNGMPTSVDWVIEAARNDPKQRMEVNSSPKVFSNLSRHND